MAVGKKGMFLTLIAVTMVAVVIALFTPTYESLPQMSRMPTIRTRVSKANVFMKSLQGALIERALVGSSYGAVHSLVDYIDAEGIPLSDVEKNFTEVLLNATINGDDLEATYGITHMRNNTLTEKLRLIREMALDQLNLDVNFTINNISMYQSNDTGFDTLGVRLNISIFLDAGLAIWNSTTIVDGLLDVDKFDDPYYLMNRGYKNPIQFSNITNWTRSLAFEHLGDMNYTFGELAPSFLMRFENDSGGSFCCGMESLINPVTLGLSDESWSYADYCFFGKNCPDSQEGDKSLWNITGISTSVPGADYYAFKLEVYHITKYNLTAYIDTRVVQEP